MNLSTAFAEASWNYETNLTDGIAGQVRAGPQMQLLLYTKQISITEINENCD